MPDQSVITIEYEDGTVVQGVIPGGLLLASSKWIDWLVAANDPLASPRKEQEDR